MDAGVNGLSRKSITTRLPKSLPFRLERRMMKIPIIEWEGLFYGWYAWVA